MDRLLISGGKKLSGIISVNGSKNATLPIIAAALLTKEVVTINNVPSLEDIKMMLELSCGVGAEVNFGCNTIKMSSCNLQKGGILGASAGRIRASILMIGSLLHRLGEVKIPLPGGCVIGSRNIDLHLSGLSALGAEMTVDEGYIRANINDGLHGANISLDFPSVGATENLLIAACLAEGTSIIRNAAKEPEIIDLSGFLNSMGADIQGAGSDTIRIHGVDYLEGTDYTVIQDRINTGTYILATAITQGHILLKDADLSFLEKAVDKFQDIGIDIRISSDGVIVTADSKVEPIDIITEVYPGFPTDLQPIIAPLLALADGESTIRETIFDNRFNYVSQLLKMGANIKVAGDTATITGVDELKGSQVNASDLRSGAALVLAGLAAKGITEIHNVYQIDRGYENLHEILHSVGADIQRVYEGNAFVSDSILSGRISSEL